MSSALVTSYSSDDDVDEYGREPKRDSDVNYDNVGMDMSSGDDDDDGKAAKGAEMFGSKEEYDAYKKHFGNKKAHKEDTSGFKTRQEVAAAAAASEPASARDTSQPRDKSPERGDQDQAQESRGDSTSRDSRSGFIFEHLLGTYLGLCSMPWQC